MKFATQSHPFRLRLRRTQPALMPPIYQTVCLRCTISENVLTAVRTSETARPVRYWKIPLPIWNAIAAGFAFSSGMAGMMPYGARCCNRAVPLSPSPIFTAARMVIGRCLSKMGGERCFADFELILDELDKLLKAHKVKLVWLETPSIAFAKASEHQSACRESQSGSRTGRHQPTPFCHAVSAATLGYGLRFCVPFRYQIFVRPFRRVDGHRRCQNQRAGAALRYDGALCRRGSAIWTAGWCCAASKHCALRMNAHCQNALEISAVWKPIPAIEKVFHPGLPSTNIMYFVQFRIAV